jgi:hypothetical protein
MTPTEANTVLDEAFVCAMDLNKRIRSKKGVGVWIK